MNSRSRSSAGRPTSGTLPRSWPRRSTLPRHSPRAFAWCQRVRRWRSGSRCGPLPSSIGRFATGTRGHAGRFTSRRSQTPAAHANAFGSCVAHYCRVRRGSCASIHGPGRADCVSSRRMGPIWLGRPDGQPARGYSVDARGVRDGRAEARVTAAVWRQYEAEPAERRRALSSMCRKISASCTPGGGPREPATC